MAEQKLNDVRDSRCLEDEGYEGNRLNGRKVSFVRGWQLGLNDEGHSGLHFEDHGLTWCSAGRTLAYLLGDLPEDERAEIMEKALKRYQDLNL